MESILKTPKREPLILELASLEKVVEELDVDALINKNRKSNEKLKLKKDERIKYFTEKFISDEKALYCDSIIPRILESNSEFCQVEESIDSMIIEREEDKTDAPEVKITTEDNQETSTHEKTGLDKLLPYHLFNCINPDMLVRINGIEFGVHRPLLKLYTTFFEDAVEDLDECIVSLPEKIVKMEVFQAIYSWMLHESEEALTFIDRRNIANMYVAAKFLKINDLVKTCKIILECRELFNEMTAFSLFMEAYNLDDIEIQRMMLPRIQSVFLHIVSSSLFVNLPIDVILKIISSDYIKVHSELEVFYSAVRWLLHDWPARSYHSIRVMNKIRFALLKPSQLVDLKRCPDSPMIKFITNGKDILKLIDDGIALSVKLDSHGGSPAAIKEECEKLGLQLPAQRCWFEEQVTSQSYDDFLQSLNIIKRKHHYS